MPPGTAGVSHVHMRAWQVFRVLDGVLTMRTLSGDCGIGPGQSVEVPPHTRHQAPNDSASPVASPVISAPSTLNDRRDLP
ncbi:cupin domain-containing protein [Jannaschia aquimarina]|nr:cupin domain-containing protein [Jannaschia aquimarina]